MADNYKVLIRSYFSDDDSMIGWEAGCPVIAEALQVSRNTETGEEFLQIRFRNLTASMIAELQWSATVTFRNGGEQTVSGHTLDADIAPGDTLSVKPVRLNGTQAQSVAVRVEAASTASAEWRTSSEPAPCPKAQSLGLSDEDKNARLALLMGSALDAGQGDAPWVCECGSSNRGFNPCWACRKPSPLLSLPVDGRVQAGDGYWMCACGAPNVNRKRCWSCQCEKATLLATESPEAIRGNLAQQTAKAAENSADASPRQGVRWKGLIAGIISAVIVLAVVVSVAVAQWSRPVDLGMEGSWQIVTEADTLYDAFPGSMAGMMNRFDSETVLSLYKDGEAFFCMPLGDGWVTHIGTWEIDRRETDDEGAERIYFTATFKEVVRGGEASDGEDKSRQPLDDKMSFSGFVADSEYWYFVAFEFGDGTGEYFGGVPYGSSVEELSYRYVIPKAQMENGSYVYANDLPEDNGSDDDLSLAETSDDSSDELAQGEASAYEPVPWGGVLKTQWYTVDLNSMFSEDELDGLTYSYTDGFEFQGDEVWGIGYQVSIKNAEGELFAVACFSEDWGPEGEYESMEIGRVQSPDYGTMKVCLAVPYDADAPNGTDLARRAADQLREYMDGVHVTGQTAEAADYILPESDSRVYTRAELEGLSVWELYLARNEVFARHGRQFRNADLAEYFGGKDWYDPTWDPDEFDGWFSPNEYEKANTDLISELEHDANSPYLS